jgi:hypothetical protein
MLVDLLISNQKIKQLNLDMKMSRFFHKQI